MKAKALLVDPTSMLVVWANESVTQGGGSTATLPVRIAQVLPVADALGIPDALAAALESGRAEHRKADLISGRQGSVALMASVYPLPDGMLLVLVEQAFQVKRKT